MNGLNMSIRLRRTPYTNRVEKLGVSGFSIVNHMLLPKAFKSSVEEDYWHLREHSHQLMEYISSHQSKPLQYF